MHRNTYVAEKQKTFPVTRHHSHCILREPGQRIQSSLKVSIAAMKSYTEKEIQATI